MAVRRNMALISFLRRCCALAACIAVSAASFAATVRSVAVRGNSAFTAREITGWLSLRPGTLFSPGGIQSDLRTIADAYLAEGYLAARAVADPPSFSGDSSLVDLVVRIDEGRRTLTGRITVEGNRLMSEREILQRFDLTPGLPFSSAMLSRDVDAMLERYERLGYPFARCSVNSIRLQRGEVADSAAIVLVVEEGGLVTLDEIRVQGNKETDASVIVRETRLRPGEPFNPAKVDAIRERLNRLNIFASVAEPELYMRSGKGGLLITVQEGNTNTFDGILGYVPTRTPGESGYLTGLASVSMRNLFGTGRKLSLKWQREDRSSQEIGVRYVEPWLFGYPVNLGGGFFQRQQDSAYVRRNIDLRSELMLSEELSVSLVFTTERVIPSGDSSIARVVSSSVSTGGLEILYDTRDDNYSPTSGARYWTGYHYGRKRVAGSPSVAGMQVSGTLQRIGVDLDFFLSTLGRQVVAVGLHGREVRTGEPQESDMYRFGGANTLRGYRENQFLGSRVAWTSTEYRFLLARRSFLFGFFDTGYYYRPGEVARGTPSSEAFRYGYGMGIRLETPLGNMGVSIALGQGDSIGSAKIHFGLINEF
ncbi:MAG: POTRA domain-containing protein [Bacteroidota bacterium]